MNTLISILCLSVCLAAVVGQCVPGGPCPISHAQARPFAIFAVRKMGPQYSLKAILRKEASVVAGILYHLTLLVQKSIPPFTVRKLTCKVRVLDVPWLNKRTLEYVNCVPFTPKTGY